MKQQFFVGDSVRITDTPQDDKHTPMGWHRDMTSHCSEVGVIQDEVRYGGSSDIGYEVKFAGATWYFAPEWLTIVERAWQNNTGRQPVDDDVLVEYKQRDMAWQAERAGDLIWTNTIVNPIAEWRIVDSVSSDEKQLLAVSHMKAWCETCQGTGEIDETVGGESFSSRNTPCPDCDGKGWWEMIMPEISSVDVPAQQEWTDKHYDNNYILTQKDIERGFVKIDPYRVSKQWQLGSKDESGVLFHILKTAARFGEKNSREREIKALYAQIKCLAEIEGVEL